jgi:O-antigen/teichoic acid export membrane protein
MIRVFWHALVFGLSPVLQKLVGLVLLPLYTHYLTAADYGEIELLSIGTGLLALVLRFELRPGYMRAWIDAPDEATRAGLFRTVLGAMLAAGAAGGAVVLLASGAAGEALLGHRIGWLYRAALALGLFADVVALVCQATLQAQLQSARMVTLGVLQFALSATLTAWGVVGLGAGPVAFFIGGAVGSLVTLAAMLAMLRPVWRRRGGAPADLAGLLAYSLPLLGGGLLFFVVRNADRLAVSQFVSVGDLGLYAMAWTLANLLLTMVFTPLQTSFDVWRYEVHRDGGREAEMAGFFRIALVVLGGAAMGLCTFGADVFARAADPRFAVALIYLPWLSVAVMLQAGYSFLASPFYVTGATGRWLRVFAIGAAVQLGLSLALVPLFGVGGAAASVLLANLAIYVGAARGGRHLWAVPWPQGRVAVLLGTTLACASLHGVIRPDSLAFMALADAAECLLFAACLLAAGLVTGGDLAALTRLAASRGAVLLRRV